MSMLKRSLFLSPLLVGCYSYTPIEPSAVPVGTEVRMHISGAASDRIAPIIGQFNQRVLTGKIDDNSAGNMTIQVQTGAALNNSETITPLTQRVPFTTGDIVQLETRRLSTGRTAVLIGVLGAAAAGIAIAALNSGGGTAGDNNGTTTGPPPINRIPVLRFHF
ncbi:MAG TPA: hypothetical protein VGM82_18000 [Gemmatimonadaceae bacterium]|jgi:hypothetical protein